VLSLNDRSSALYRELCSVAFESESKLSRGTQSPLASGRCQRSENARGEWLNWQPIDRWPLFKKRLIGSVSSRQFILNIPNALREKCRNRRKGNYDVNRNHVEMNASVSRFSGGIPNMNTHLSLLMPVDCFQVWDQYSWHKTRFSIEWDRENLKFLTGSTDICEFVFCRESIVSCFWTVLLWNLFHLLFSSFILHCLIGLPHIYGDIIGYPRKCLMLSIPIDIW
jgi:hypothetical protein